jgi:hypothetical protein
MICQKQYKLKNCLVDGTETSEAGSIGGLSACQPRGVVHQPTSLPYRHLADSARLYAVYAQLLRRGGRPMSAVVAGMASLRRPFHQQQQLLIGQRAPSAEIFTRGRCEADTVAICRPLVAASAFDKNDVIGTNNGDAVSHVTVGRRYHPYT